MDKVGFELTTAQHCMKSTRNSAQLVLILILKDTHPSQFLLLHFFPHYFLKPTIFLNESAVAGLKPA
jgi:hypothetical protein